MRKHSVSIRGHRTSFSLEDEFWDELKALANRQNISVAKLVETVDEERGTRANLSSALRLHVLRSLKGDQPSGDGRNSRS